ncbi:Ankyrin-1, partial [Tetrabaena socialis]
VGKADVASAVSADGWTPLHLASRTGAADKGSTALHLASINGHAAVVEALLAAGAPKELALPRLVLAAAPMLTRPGFSPAILLQFFGRPSHVWTFAIDRLPEMLLLRCPQDAGNGEGKRPLDVAKTDASSQCPPCPPSPQPLLTPARPPADGPFDQPTCNRFPTVNRIFHFAGKGSAEELRALLAESKAKGPSGAGAAEGSGAAGSGGGMSLRVVDSEGATPLNLAIHAESLETVKVILEHDGSMVNYPDMSGSTPLHTAVEVGNLHVLRYLLDRQPPPEMNVQVCVRDDRPDPVQVCVCVRKDRPDPVQVCVCVRGWGGRRRRVQVRAN